MLLLNRNVGLRTTIPKEYSDGTSQEGVYCSVGASICPDSERLALVVIDRLPWGREQKL